MLYKSIYLSDYNKKTSEKGTFDIFPHKYKKEEISKYNGKFNFTLH